MVLAPTGTDGLTPPLAARADHPQSRIVAVRVAILDDPSRFAPGFVSYANSALDWDSIDPTLTSFAKMPPLPA